MIFSPSSSSPLASRSTPPSAILSSKLLSKLPSGSTKKRKKSRTILKLKNHPLCRTSPLYTVGLLYNENPIPAHTGMGFAFFKAAPASNRPYNKNSRIVYM